MRRREGHRLRRELLDLLRRMEDLKRRIRQQVPRVQRGLEAKWAARIRKLAATAEPRAAAAEAASWLQATDVSEELQRIQSHLVALHEVVAQGGESPGRTLDFLAQELQREVNTLGAKIRDASVVRNVVAMKGHIEKLREQAANVE